MARGAAVVLVLLMVVVAQHRTAAAEGAAPDRFRIGPVHLAPRVLLTSYSGLSTTGYGAEADLPADNVTTLTPSLHGAIPIGTRLRLTGSVATHFGLFAPGEEHAFSFTGYSTWSGAEVSLGPLSFFGSIGGGRGKERFAVTLDRRARRHETSRSFGVSARLGSRVSTTASRTDRTSTFESDALDADVSELDGAVDLDRESTTYRYQASLALTRQTSLTASADVIDDYFVADEILERSYRYLGGFQFSPTAFIRGRVLAGYRTRPESERSPSYDATVLGVGATMPFFGFGTIGGSLDRDTTYLLSGEAGERQTVVVFRRRVEFRTQLPLSLIAVAHYGKDEIKNVVTASDVPSPANSIRRYGGSLFRAFGRTLRIGGTLEVFRPEGEAAGDRRYLVSAEWTP